MTKVNLDKYQEITDLNFDGEDPHLAVCSTDLNGGSANGCGDTLLFKSVNNPPQPEVKLVDHDKRVSDYMKSKQPKKEVQEVLSTEELEQTALRKKLAQQVKKLNSK